MALLDQRAARAAYEALADDYDRLTAHHDYALWTGTVTDLLTRHGARGRRLLDVGCGTGRSTAALAAHGYAVTGVDVAPAMLRAARRRVGEDVPLVAADVRALPDLGPFDVVTMLDDVVNYVPAGDLGAAFARVREVMAPAGRLLFDANTLGAYRRHFSATEVIDDEAGLLLWRGLTSRDLPAGGVAALTIEAFRRDAKGTYARRTSHHRQHHHPPELILAALATAGLEVLAVCGQGFDAVPERPLDEDRHSKGLYVARRAHPEPGEEVTECSASRPRARSSPPRRPSSRGAEAPPDPVRAGRSGAGGSPGAVR